MTHYSKAPITEALIDLRVKPTPGLKMGDLERAQLLDESAYPSKKRLYAASVHFEEGEDAAPTPLTTRQERGWAFVSPDRLQVWQARTDGFTFSRLAPYKSWQPFRDEARRLWLLTKEILEGPTVTRLAVRYINRIELPLPLKDFKDYLRTVPEVSPDLPQGLSRYFMQLHVPLSDLKAMLILNESLMPTASEETVPVILDFDLFRVQEIPQDEDALWTLLEEFHTRKNELFEGCITERTREMII